MQLVLSRITEYMKLYKAIFKSITDSGSILSFPLAPTLASPDALCHITALQCLKHTLKGKSSPQL